MSTLTARQPTTSRYPRTPVVVIAFIIVALAAAAVILPRVLSTSTVTHPAVVTAYAGGGGGNASHSHPVRGRPGLSGPAAASARAAAAAELVVAHQRQYLQQLLDQQTRLVDNATPRDGFAINRLTAQVAAARKALANALQAEKALTSR